MSATSTLSRTPGPIRVVIKSAVSRLTPAEPSLRAALLKGTLSRPDPWQHPSRARLWVQRAQGVVDDIATGKDPDACRRGLEALTREVEGDADFQEARQLF